MSFTRRQNSCITLKASLPLNQGSEIIGVILQAASQHASIYPIADIFLRGEKKKEVRK